MTLKDLTVEQLSRLKAIQKAFTDEASILKEICSLFNIKTVKEGKLFLEKLNVMLLEEAPFTQRFTFEGVEYGFIPSLEDISTDEYMDLSSYQGDENQTHRMLSILYRPINSKNGELYTIEDYNGTKYADIMRKVPCTILLGSIGFFLTLSEHCLRDSLTYLRKQNKKLQSQKMVK